MSRFYRNLIFLSILVISVAMHFNTFSKDLISIHVWRQTQTQSNIINFYEEDMNILNPHRNDRGNGNGVFRMEFPLMQWLVACTYKVFGNHLIICRIFMFIVGLFSVFGMYKLLHALFGNEIIAIIGAWTFNWSPCFYYYTVNPLPDNLALCCSLWGLTMFFFWYRNQKPYYLLISGLLLSLGALCKLPFILYFSVPLTYFVIYSFDYAFNKKLFLNAIASGIFIILPVTWYLAVIPQWSGNGIVKGMLGNNVPFRTYLDYFQHNLVSTLPELLLNYGSVLFFLSGFYFMVIKKMYKKRLFMVFVVLSTAVSGYFFFELNMIAKIHDYYLFPFYPLLFIIVSYGAYNLFLLENRKVKYTVLFLLLILPLTAYLRMHIRWNVESPGFNKDLLVYKTELRKAVPKDALCIAGSDDSHYIFFYYIDKKGWAYDENNSNAQNFKEMIANGAQYLYSDSRQYESDPNVLPYLDKMILNKGSIRVYSLKAQH